MPSVSSTTPDLMGMVSRFITPDVIQRAAAALGEDREKTARAVSTSVPSVLTALSDVASSPTGANHIEDLIAQTRRGEPQAGGSPIWSGSTTTEAGTRLFDDELGARSSSITDALAGSSGIRRDSAHKLLGGVTAATLVALGRNMLGASALRSASREQRGEWVRALPGPLASQFGGSAYGATAPAATAAPDATTLDRERFTERERVSTARPGAYPGARPRPRWLIPLIILAAAFLAYSLVKGFRRPPERTTQNVTRTMPGSPSGPAMVPFRLPDGQTLSLPAGSGIQQFASYLGGPDRAVPQRFPLSPFGFQSNTAQVTPDSITTVNNVAALLNAYPSTEIAVASFTDNTGQPEANLALTSSRADAIKELIVARGVDPARVEAVGFGQDHPIASNDTPEGRLANRRSEIVVTKR